MHQSGFEERPTTTNHLVSEDANFNGIVQLSHRNRETLTAAFPMVEPRELRQSSE